VYAVATVQEEIGARGANSAFGIDPQVGIAVDVGFATDFREWTTQEEVGRGEMAEDRSSREPKHQRAPLPTPVSTAETKKIPYQFDTCRENRNGRNTIQIVRGGVATAVLGVPNRYMHSPCELVHLDDVEHTIELMAETVARMRATTNLIPGSPNGSGSPDRSSRFPFVRLAVS